MIDPILFLAFLTTTILFVVVPGPSVAFATAQALRHGKRAALIAVAGDALGTTAHIIIAVGSLSLLVALSDVILPFLQILGGLFLLYLAYRAFTTEHTQTTQPTVADKTTFWAGFFACVTNPKAIAFFVALFPAFISPDHNVIVQSLVYGVIFIVLDALSIIGFAFFALYAVSKTKSRWLRPNVLSGLGLLGVGFAMIAKGYRSIPSH